MFCTRLALSTNRRTDIIRTLTLIQVGVSNVRNRDALTLTSESWTTVLQAVNNFMAGTLSAFYFDLSKDVLYSDAESSARREAIVAVMAVVRFKLYPKQIDLFTDPFSLIQVCRILKDILAPLTPHLVHEIDAHLGDAGEYTTLEVSHSSIVQLLILTVDIEQTANEVRVSGHSDTAIARDSAAGFPSTRGVSDE
jgi:hypothetical protein